MIFRWVIEDEVEEPLEWTPGFREEVAEVVPCHAGPRISHRFSILQEVLLMGCMILSFLINHHHHLNHLMTKDMIADHLHLPTMSIGRIILEILIIEGLVIWIAILIALLETHTMMIDHGKAIMIHLLCKVIWSDFFNLKLFLVFSCLTM